MCFCVLAALWVCRQRLVPGDSYHAPSLQPPHSGGIHAAPLSLWRQICVLGSGRQAKALSSGEREGEKKAAQRQEGASELKVREDLALGLLMLVPVSPFLLVLPGPSPVLGSLQLMIL